MGEKKPLDMAAAVFVLVGGLNWGLVGAFGLNLVDTIFKSVPIVARLVYIVVGLAALYGVYGLAMKK